jgi:hypothetical protein
MAGRSQTKITKRLVDQLKPGEVLWDAEVRGFGVRCQTNDRVYVLKCFVKGRQRWVTIGKHGSPWTIELARKEAQSLLIDARRGNDPADTRRQLRGRPTVASLCERYLEEHADRHKKPRSAHSDRKNIENHVIPLMGKLPVEAVTRSDIEVFQQGVSNGKTAPSDPRAKQLLQRGGHVVRGGKGAANRCLTLLSKMFNLAEDWGMRAQNSNPVRRITRFREFRRDRYLTADEFSRLGKALNEAEMGHVESPFAIAALRLLISDLLT